MNRAGLSALVLSLMLSVVSAQSPTAGNASPQTPVGQEVPVEVFHILELPITITDTVLVKTKSGYFLKCSLSNSSEFRQLGLRYSLAIIDSMNVTKGVVTRNEGFRLAGYKAKSVTFKTPIKLSLKGDERFVLMLEQIVSTHYVWDVLKAKDSLAAYTAGDYSITPRVLRVSNQVDAPIPLNRLNY